MKFKEQERVFRNWMSRHEGLMFKIVRAYAVNRHDQEDLFQEIAAQLWASIPNFKKKSAETTWIYRVALFCSMSWTRKEKRIHKGKNQLGNAETFISHTKKREDPRLAWLYEQINQLPVLERSLTLLLLDGYSYKEMSSMLGLSESHVGVKINRIKTKLTKKSKEHGGTENGL